MTVTKQQQLKWLAKAYKTWPEQGSHSLRLSAFEIGKFAIVNCHVITRKEWKQERYKMQKKDNSWHERGEFPPVGVVCEVLNNELYNPAWEKCTIIFMGEYKCIYSSEARSEIVGDVYSTGAIEFRPLRTERERAIDEMDAAIRNRGSAISNVILGELYDAGFRMVNQ